LLALNPHDIITRLREVLSASLLYHLPFGIVEELIAGLSGNSELLLYAALFVLLTLCGLGLPLPEDIPLIAAGYLSHTGDMKLPIAMVVAMTAVLLGDTFIFLIGRKWGLSILSHRWMRRILPESRLEKVRLYFTKYGDYTIFFARFIVGFRAATFWAAGTLKVPYAKFILFDGLAALVSVPAFVFIGWYFGDEFEQAIEWLKRIERLVIVLGATAVLSLVVYEFKKRRSRKARGVSETGGGDEKEPRG
jgi:membrane protein DedA with SNARE-associated domain